jgi:hypothetical protein
LLLEGQCGVRQVVVDEEIWAQVFQPWELGLFLLDGALLCVCLGSAILGTVQLGVLARRGWTCLSRMAKIFELAFL